MRLEQLAQEQRANDQARRRADKARITTQREAAVAVAASAKARVVYREASSHVAIANDSQVTVNGSPVLITVSMPVVSQLRSGSDLARKDSLSIVKLAADVAACGDQNAVYLDRIRILEATIAEISPSKCGWKCGAAGATLAILGVLLLAR